MKSIKERTPQQYLDDAKAFAQQLQVNGETKKILLVDPQNVWAHPVLHCLHELGKSILPFFADSSWQVKTLLRTNEIGVTVCDHRIADEIRRILSALEPNLNAQMPIILMSRGRTPQEVKHAFFTDGAVDVIDPETYTAPIIAARIIINAFAES